MKWIKLFESFDREYDVNYIEDVCMALSDYNLKLNDVKEGSAIQFPKDKTIVTDSDDFDMSLSYESLVLSIKPIEGGFLINKESGIATPLIERKKGILEVPIHLYVERDEKGLMATENEMPMSTIAKFWYGMDRCQFNPEIRDENTDELSLFMFDIIHSLSERQRDYLIHARLAHLPRKAILQMIKNGAKGLPYQGKFKELCRPCLEAKQRAENHGKATIRHPDGKIGEHLHSDLAVVNSPDFSGFKYVLTVVDEISDEVVVTLLKTKGAETVLKACKETLQLISARNNNSKLKTWQFDRGGEFLNQLFDEWIIRHLGAKQLFSNVEHPWENGRAERSFQTIFSKARAMLKYADLPNGLWGKAVPSIRTKSITFLALMPSNSFIVASL